MIKRRHFLGSVAAFLATPVVSRLSATSAPGAASTGTLNWQNDVIETVPHNSARRSPVVTGVSLQPAGGDLLAIVGDDHYICLYDIKEQRYIEHLNNHTDWIRTAKFSPDGTKLATGGNDRRLLLWSDAAGAVQQFRNAIQAPSLNVLSQMMARNWRPSDSNQHCESTIPRRAKRSSNFAVSALTTTQSRSRQTTS